MSALRRSVDGKSFEGGELLAQTRLLQHSQNMHDRRWLRLAVFTLITAVGCGGSDSSTTQPTGQTTPIVASVTVAPNTAQIVVGATTALSASAFTSAGVQISGRTPVWESGTPAIAAVNNGVVTGLAPGASTITATIDGKSGSAVVTVTANSGNVLEIASGDQQRGLTGRALADSLIVRARTASGAAVAGASVNWTSSSGTLSTGSTVTDATGMARVQWIAGSGDATASASMQGSAATIFRANGRANGACVLTPSAQTQRFSLGATDFTLSLRATSPHKIVALFVDFSDAPTTETPQSVMSLIVDPGVLLMKELSYNRTDITVTPVAKWYRMSKTSASYSWSTFAGHKAFFQEAMGLADADVDFSPYDAVYVFASANAAQVVSPTFNGGPSNGFTFDGRVFGNGVTFGQDARRFGPAILAHETHHMFGLVDLYSYDPAAGTPYQGNQFRDVGAWSLMSNVFTPGHTFAWEKRKLGFLDDAQVDCLEGTPGGEEAVIQPVETPGGLKMIGVPLDANRALVVEVRSNQGLDANLCAQGVLIYEVNAAAASGVDPAKVRGSRVSTTGTAFARCGPWADATFGVGSGDVSLFTDAASGVSVRVLRAESGGAYRVRVKR